MPAYFISASRLINAPAEQLYGIIADYRTGHPEILPKPPFVSLAVEQGGVGAGTVINVQMRMLGQNSSFRSVISEPEPGRVLVETNDNNFVTTFTVEQQPGSQQSLVTIVSETSVRDGMVGALQGWFFTRLLRPTYIKELENLATVATTRGQVTR